MRVIGLDVHRSFAQVAELKDGVLRQRGRLDLVRHKVLEFARTLGPDDEVVLEATGNTMAIVRLLKPHACRHREPVAGVIRRANLALLYSAC